MNISFSLSPATSAELDSMLDVLKRHGFTAQSCPVSIVKPAPSTLQADTWESKWRMANPGKGAPKYNELKRAVYPTKEDFFKALMSSDETEGEGTEETEEETPAPVVPVAELDVDDI